MIVAVIDMLYPFDVLSAVTTSLLFNNKRSDKKPLLIVECSRYTCFSPMSATLAKDTELATTITFASYELVIVENGTFWCQPFIQQTNNKDVDLLLLQSSEGIRVSEFRSHKEVLEDFFCDLGNQYQHIVVCTPEINDLVSLIFYLADKIVIHSLQGFTPLPSATELLGKTVAVTSKIHGVRRKTPPRTPELFRSYRPGMWDSKKIGHALRTKT